MLADGEDFQRSFQLKRNWMRALDAVRSTALELSAVKLSTMILDILVICPMGSLLRPTYVRCPTKHTNFMYRQGCIWMKVCQHWCRLDRDPLQAHCAWKCPLASWNMQLPWLDSVPAGSQSLHKNFSHHVRMRTNDLRCLPYTEAGRASRSRFGRITPATFNDIRRSRISSHSSLFLQLDYVDLEISDIRGWIKTMNTFNTRRPGPV